TWNESFVWCEPGEYTAPNVVQGFGENTLHNCSTCLCRGVMHFSGYRLPAFRLRNRGIPAQLIRSAIGSALFGGGCMFKGNRESCRRGFCGSVTCNGFIQPLYFSGGSTSKLPPRVVGCVVKIRDLQAKQIHVLG